MVPPHERAKSVQDTGLSGLAIVASGIDSLYLSGGAASPESLWPVLKEYKEAAQEADAPIEFTLAGEEVAMRAGGLGRYTFRLDHQYGVVGLTISKAFPILRFQPRAEFLHGVGPRNMVAWLSGWMCDVLDKVRLTVARVDVFADTTGWALEASDRRRFLCRADLRDTHEKGEAWTGFEFGRRKGGNVMARIYDKSHEVREHPGKAWWFDIWGDRLRPKLRELTMILTRLSRAAISFRIATVRSCEQLSMNRCS